MTGTRIYRIFNGAKQRCLNPKSPCFRYYGGKGVKIEWKNFEDFYSEMKEGYSDKLSLDRINPNGNYCKKNCRWVTAYDQANNTTSNIKATINGVTKNVTQWCVELGLSQQTVFSRINRTGMSPEEALSQKSFIDPSKQAGGLRRKYGWWQVGDEWFKKCPKCLKSLSVEKDFTKSTFQCRKCYNKYAKIWRTKQKNQMPAV